MTSRYTARPVKRIALQPRDIDILRALRRVPFARTSFLQAIAGGSAQSVLRRLRLMKCPPQRLVRLATHPLVNGNPFVEQIFEIDLKGKRTLTGLGIDVAPALYNVKNRREFPHTLMLCDFFLNVELGVRAPVISCQHMVENTPDGRPAIPLPDGRTIEPDGMFGVSGEGPAFFFVEADRRTETLTSTRDPTRSSYHRKLTAYRTIYDQELHRSQFGIRRNLIYVLNIVSSQPRMQRMMRLAADVGLTDVFLFRHLPALGGIDPQPKPDPLLMHAWINANGDPVHPLLNIGVSHDRHDRHPAEADEKDRAGRLSG